MDSKGQFVLLSYDHARRLTSSVSAEETRSFGPYDKLGNVLQVVDGTGATTYTYDSLSRVTAETRATTGQQSYTIESEYDLDGRRTKVTYPTTGRVLSQVYDPAGRLTSIADGTGSSGVTSAYQLTEGGAAAARASRFQSVKRCTSPRRTRRPASSRRRETADPAAARR